MKKRRFDYVIALVVLGLALFGVVMVFSASYYSAQTAGKSALTNGIKQAVLTAIGTGVMAFLVFFRYTQLIKYRFSVRIPIPAPLRTTSHWRLLWRSWESNAYITHIQDVRGRFYVMYSVPLLPFLVLMVGFAGLVALLFVGEERLGATRWLSIFGISVQPSEIARMGMLLYVADDLAANHKAIPRCTNFFALCKLLLPSFFVLGSTVVLILSGKSMSVAMTVLFLFMALLIAAGTKGRHLGVISLLGAGLGAALIAAEPFRRARMSIFRNPWKDPLGDGYQLIQSLYALANGGLFGAGPGGSRQKFAYLTFGESDFILSIIAEEYGFIGVLLLLLAFGLLVYRGYRVAIKAEDSYGAFLATGFASVIWIQLVINALVISSSMPPTGLPLPFISAGGSSLVIYMAQMGILLNISRHTRTQ